MAIAWGDETHLWMLSFRENPSLETFGYLSDSACTDSQQG